MSAIDDILKQLPIKQLAGQVGASESDTKTAVTHAVTSLLGGMSANAADGGESALTAAVASHVGGTTTDVSKVDTADGAKIVKKVLGASPKAAAAAVADKTGTNSDLLAKIMPIVAPMILAYLGSKLTNGSAGGTAVASGLGGLLGNMLGGGTQAASGSSTGGGISDLLGGLLGGSSVPAGNSAASSGGLSGILNSIF